MNHIILFDGECNFCDRSVQFIIKRDHQALYRFASLQSDIGQEIIREYRVAANIDSIILLEDGTCYFRSTAALKICRHLHGGWKLLYSFIIVPKPLRDAVYNIIAKNRFKWFGKKRDCQLPSPEIRKRFLN